MSSHKKIIDLINAFAHQEADNLVQFLTELIEIKSVTGQEEAVVGHVARKMRSSGFDEVFTDSIGSIIGRVGHGPVVLVYDAHLDTVGADPAAWDSDPFKAVIKDGRLYGRGAVDDKGPFACLLFAAKAIKSLGLDRDITLYISGSVAEEDSEGLALKTFLHEHRLNPDAVLIAEASDLQICRGHRGRALLEAEFSGTPVHASIHEQGDNPIEKALPFATGVGELDKRLLVDPVLGRGDIVVTKVECQSHSLNTLPATCKVIMDRRLTTRDTRESVLAELQALPSAETAKINVLVYEDQSYNGFVKSCDEFFPAWIMAPDHPLIRDAQTCYRDIFESDADVTVWGFSTNGTYSMGEAGIPTVGFGPGKGELAHRDNEYVEVADLVQALRFYTYLPMCIKS